MHFQTNTFQCVLATSEGESFVIFLYEKIQWTTGISSGGSRGLGGTEALAGINAGNYIYSITIPGSKTPSIINITQTSNVGISGTWMFSLKSMISVACLQYCVHALIMIRLYKIYKICVDMFINIVQWMPHKVKLVASAGSN